MRHTDAIYKKELVGRGDTAPLQKPSGVSAPSEARPHVPIDASSWQMGNNDPRLPHFHTTHWGHCDVPWNPPNIDRHDSQQEITTIEE